MTPASRASLSVFALLFFCLQEPGSRADEAADFFKRHPHWMQADELSKEFVAMIPADEGMDVGLIIGGSRQISEAPPVFKYAIADNKAKTIIGELRYMRKEQNPDVLQGFIDLAKRENGAITYYAEIKKGDSQNGLYFLFYQNKTGLQVYEKIINEYDIAISYRLACKKGDPEEPAVRKMAADFVALPK